MPYSLHTDVGNKYSLSTSVLGTVLSEGAITRNPNCQGPTHRAPIFTYMLALCPRHPESRLSDFYIHSKLKSRFRGFLYTMQKNK